MQARATAGPAGFANCSLVATCLSFRVRQEQCKYQSTIREAPTAGQKARAQVPTWMPGGGVRLHFSGSVGGTPRQRDLAQGGRRSELRLYDGTEEGTDRRGNDRILVCRTRHVTRLSTLPRGSITNFRPSRPGRTSFPDTRLLWMIRSLLRCVPRPGCRILEF